MTDLAPYSGRLALVTGAGDGIGAMLARGFADAGMTVCVQDIRADAAEAVAAEIGGSAFPMVFDVSDRDACFEAAETMTSRRVPLSLLWINAGVGVGSAVLSGKPNAIEWGFGVNVFGVIWTAQAFRPLMTDETGPRHVGVTASTAALRPPDGDWPLYALTKHCTFSVAETLRGELAKDGIETTILCPGLLNTKIWDGAKARPERFGGVRHMDPKTSAYWDAAQDPVVMWTHITRTVREGGGYLVCNTDADTASAFKQRTDDVLAGLVQL